MTVFHTEPLRCFDLKHICFGPTAKPGLPALQPVAFCHPNCADVLSSNTLAYWVLERAGLDARSYRPEPLLRRVPACLRALKVTDEAAAKRRIEEQPELLRLAVSELLIGVTEFFRDPLVFEALRRHILPALCRQRRPRVWSASCSNGAELYSLAILLAEAGRLDHSVLLGTDCRADAIAEAHEAIYPAEAARLMDENLRSTYLSDCGGLYRVESSIRRGLKWKVSDLNTQVEKGPWDLILWRNTSIYMTLEAARHVWQQLASVLAPGGVVVAGTAERPPADLGLVSVGRCLFARIRSTAREPNLFLCPLLEAS